MFRNYGFMVTCYFAFFLVLGVLSIAFPDFDFERYQQSELFDLLAKNPIQFILLAVIFAPILEEGAFRSLIKPSVNEIFIFFCSWIILITVAVMPEGGHWLLKYGFLFLFILLIFIILKSVIPTRWLRKMRIFLFQHYKIIWGFTAVIFGLVHIGNYVDSIQFNFLLFLLIFPRIIAGYFFGKIKIENKSLLWPILMHALNNGIIVLLLYPLYVK